MEEIILFLLGASLIISLLHLLISAFIMKNKFHDSPNPSNFKRTLKYPKISILKPIKGIDDQIESNLRTFFKNDYPNFELLFGFDNADEPAISIVKKMMSEYPKVECKIIIDGFRIGLNPKVSNMHNIYPSVTGEYIFISDSNTRIEHGFFYKLLGEFDNPNVGLVTATIRGLGAKNLTSVFENLHLNTFVAPSVFIAKKFADISIVIGKSILIPKLILQKAGGFISLKNYLAEDFQLGTKVRKLGYDAITSETMVDNINERISFERFINRHSRWAKMRRHIDFKHYSIESFSNPIFTSLIMFSILQDQFGLYLLIATIGTKIIHDLYISKLLKSDVKWYHLAAVPLKDLVIALIWFTPFFSYNIKWRDNRIKIGKDSLLQST